MTRLSPAWPSLDGHRNLARSPRRPVPLPMGEITGLTVFPFCSQDDSFRRRATHPHPRPRLLKPRAELVVLEQRMVEAREWEERVGTLLLGKAGSDPAQMHQLALRGQQSPIVLTRPLIFGFRLR